MGINKYEISVVVPCYQVEQYIKESVLSMKNQSFRNYEIVLVDDGSMDRTIPLAMETLENFDRVKVVHQTNSGLPAARNTGIKAAEGKYVCFLDSDDIISPSHLMDLYNLCESEKLNACFSLFETTKEDNRNGAEVNDAKPTIFNRSQLMKNAMDRKIRIHCCSLLINRDFLLKNDLYFNEKLKYAEDTEYRWRLFPKLEKIGCTNKATYKYLTRSNSLMTSQNVDRVLTALDELDKTINNNLTEFPEDERIWSLLPQRIFLSLCRSFARSANYSTFKELIIKSNKKIDLPFIIHYKDTKVKILAMVFFVSKKLFCRISKI